MRARRTRTVSSLVVLSAERFEALSLGVGIDICANDKSNDIEEWHPGMFGEEILRERQGDRRCDPADFHDRHETSADGGADLVEGARAGNNGHRDQVYGILNRSDLQVI